MCFLQQKGAKSLETSSPQANRLPQGCSQDPGDCESGEYLRRQDAERTQPRNRLVQGCGASCRAFKKPLPASDPVINFLSDWHRHTPKNGIYLSKTESLLISSSSYYYISLAITKPPSTRKIQAAMVCPVRRPKGHICKRYYPKQPQDY